LPQEPGFQPAFVLQTTLGFYEEGLSRSAYYHIRDYYVDEAVFSRILSRSGAVFMARWWNTMPQYDGLRDRYGRMRPAYFAFKLLSLIHGVSIPVAGMDRGVYAIAAKEDASVNLLVWSFPDGDKPEMREATIRFSGIKTGQFRQIHLNTRTPRNELELIRHGQITDLVVTPIQMALEPYGFCWIMIGE
jgi:hypothetical protein